MAHEFGLWNLIKSLIYRTKPEDLIEAGTSEGNIHRLYLNGVIVPHVHIWDKKNKMAWIYLIDSQGRIFVDENNHVILGTYYLPDAELIRADDQPIDGGH